MVSIIPGAGWRNGRNRLIPGFKTDRRAHFDIRTERK
jgi:hypothetical protein